MFPLFTVLLFGVLVFIQCKFLSTTELVLVTFKRYFLYFNLSDPNTVLPLLAGPHWRCQEAGDSGAEGLGASGPGVGSQGAGGLGAGAQ